MSCKYCKPLFECPIGKKVKSVLDERKYAGSYEKFMLVRDHDPEKDDFFFTIQGYDNIHNEYINSPWNINYCPMCGEKLEDNT